MEKETFSRVHATEAITSRDWAGGVTGPGLRTTFGTMLSMAGVATRTAKVAMRHSRIVLTMNIYTDPTLLDVSGAIGSLPNVRPSNPRPSDGLKATGTNNASLIVHEHHPRKYLKIRKLFSVLHLLAYKGIHWHMGKQNQLTPKVTCNRIGCSEIKTP